MSAVIDREEGFTLIELIVSIAILGIIMVTIGVTFALTVLTTSQTSDRYKDSRGPKFTAAYWPADVAASEKVDPGAGDCGGSAALASFAWTDAQNQAQTDTASWFVDTAGGTRQLVRKLCNGSLGSPVRTTVIVPRLGPADPAVTCDGGSCAADATPQGVLLDVTTLSGYGFKVDGTRVTLNPSGTGGDGGDGDEGDQQGGGG